MKLGFRALIAVFVLMFSAEGYGQRITVRNADGSVRDQSSDERRERREHPFAINLHLSNILFGEYLASVEYEMFESFALQAGAGLTSHDANFAADLDILNRDLPSSYQEGDGLGYSYISSVNWYVGEDALESGMYFGAGIAGRSYRFLQQVQTTGDIYPTSRNFSEYYLSVGLTFEIDPNFLFTIKGMTGIRNISGVRYEAQWDGTDYTTVPFDIDDSDGYVNISITLGYVFE